MNKVVVDPVTRIEGHLRIEAETDGSGIITRASSSGTMLRGIEVIMQDRDPRDAWAFTQRICGVCTSSHSIAAVRAVEDALQYPIPENARIIRNLINGAQYVHDHVVHFYHLHALDWVDVVSALKADPTVTAEAQKCISPNRTENISAAYFSEVQTKLKNFVESGQLGIFKNGYWGHPEYKLPPEINLLAFAHYLEALGWQRSIARLHAVFGGRNPHPNFVVGGVPCAISNEEGDTRIDGEGLSLVGELIREVQTFIDQVYLPDTLAIARFYPEWFKKGEGVGNFLTFGDFPLTTPSAGDHLLDTDNLLIPRGIILDRDLTTIHPLDLNDPEQIQELVSHSWYDYSVGKDTPLHPYDGETNPNYTGPQPPFDYLDVDGSYSWIKSPRWRGKAMEVGPLSHVLMLFATGHEATQELVNSSLRDLKLPLNALYSTMGRTAARTLEAKIIADEMYGWYDQLNDNIQSGDLRVHNDEFFDPATWPAQARGAGFLEAPRGALGHWIVIEDGKTANYQAVVPTTWNAGPRTTDAAGNEITGPYDAALAGHSLHDPNQPLEILRTIHSFDPCLGCAVHLVGPDGDELIQVKVQ
ncbi:MAG: nickel-dependent hydrogenase large subunit [Chromatiales bacterium]|nr:nickel-dependent hydrogenase large subunit [Chromatiales bacterium]